MRLTYLFDPLCGWCYGAGPTIERLALLDDVTVDLAPTGLFAGAGARPMDADFAAYAWHNDMRIARLTGQPFSSVYRHQVLEAVGSLFDSAPATLGIVAMGLDGAASELDALKLLQRARYSDGCDTSNLAVVCDVIAGAGFRQAADRIDARDQTLVAAYEQRIAAARADMADFAIQGVPALIIGSGAKRRALAAGALFGNFDLLVAQVRSA